MNDKELAERFAKENDVVTKLGEARGLLAGFPNNRKYSLVKTKIDEAVLWLSYEGE